MIDIDAWERLAQAAFYPKPGMDGFDAEVAFNYTFRPAAILELCAEMRRLRAALATPVAMKIKWSPMSENMVSGFSQSLGEDALARDAVKAKNVTVYYGEKRVYTTMAEFSAAHPKAAS